MTSLFEDHLSLDAVVAFADGEMGLLAYQRAAAHLSRCPRCAAEVAEQTTAREFLRSAGTPRMPLSLFDQLRSIPVAVPNPPPVPGLQGADRSMAGSADSPSRHRSRRFRLGAGLLMAGIAVGALAGVAGSEHPEPNGLPIDGSTLRPITVPANPAIAVMHRTR